MSYYVCAALVIFLATYGFIVSEKVNRTVIALVGAVLMILAGVIGQSAAIHHIDFNTLALLIGMMIQVYVLSKTGLFDYLAIFVARKTKGHPVALLIALMFLVAVCSGFLDNVTTVLLTIPIAFSLAKDLRISPLPFVIGQILASNIGGTATMIGDPPNIMIASKVKELDFMAFITNLAAPCLVILVITAAILAFIYRKELVCKDEDRLRVMNMSLDGRITNKSLLVKCLICLGFTILLFCTHSQVPLWVEDMKTLCATDGAMLNGFCESCKELFDVKSLTLGGTEMLVESGACAMVGAAILLLITMPCDEHQIEETLKGVEWGTIFFFAGLFVLVGGLQERGIIKALAQWSIDVTGGEQIPTTMVVLWLSAIMSAFVDNIPFVATMIPLIQDMGVLQPNLELEPLWWALALGACLGGNGTAIGASANVVSLAIARSHGLNISFFGFMKIAFGLMLLSIVIAMFYLLAFYL